MSPLSLTSESNLNATRFHFAAGVWMCQQWPALDEATGHEQHGLTLVALHAPLFTFLFAWMLPCMLKSRLSMGIPKIL